MKELKFVANPGEIIIDNRKLVSRASFPKCDSRAFPAAPFRRGLVHVLLEESVEILYQVVAKKRCNCADLAGRKNAEQPLRMSEPCLYLALDHRYPVFVKEGSFECSYLCAEFSSNGCKAQLHIAVRIEDEMMRSARGAFKKRGIEAIFGRRSHCPNLSNDFNLDSRQLAVGAACHSCSLQAEGR